MARRWLVRAEIVHDDDIAALRGARSETFDVRKKALPLIGPSTSHEVAMRSWRNATLKVMVTDGMWHLGFEH